MHWIHDNSETKPITFWQSLNIYNHEIPTVRWTVPNKSQPGSRQNNINETL